jgi:hypothetical protein
MKPYIAERYDIRPIDFASGKRLAIPTEQQETCQCCGKRIVKVVKLTNGDKIGSECANLVDLFRFYSNDNIKASAAFGVSEKQASYFRSI